MNIIFMLIILLLIKKKRCKKMFKVPKRSSEYVNRRWTNNIMVKREKRQKDKSDIYIKR